MVRFLNIYGFLAVLLRAATLVFQSLVIGGIVFRIAVLKSPDRDSSHAHNIRSACDKLLRVGILALVVTQTIFLFVNSAVLMITARLTPRDLLGANYVFSALTVIAVGATLLVLLGRKTKWSLAGMLVSCVALLVATVTTNHAAARIEGRFLLSLLTGLHLSGAFIWIGGLPYLLLTIAKSGGEEEARVFTSRFSRLAVICVGLLLSSGFAISCFYVDSPQALYGTAYGVMLGAKAALLGLLLLLGRLNYGIVHAFRTGEIARRLRRFAEVEVAIGFAAILAAASLTSQPPAVDLKLDRVSATEIYQRMRPRLPRLETPSVREVSPSSRQAEKRIAAGAPAPSSFVAGAQIIYPNTPADIAWSEYNHNWVGLLVLSMGVLALLTRGGRVQWSRHWPLILLILSVFILLRADPEGWPLGPDGFWEGFDQAEVASHRIFALLIAAFAIFEWRVQQNKSTSRFAKYVFPAVCALGGALLLTHSHSLGNIKEELLAELSHVPLALLGVIAGCARWLELRLRPNDRRIPALIWPICFVLIGALLLNYREA